MRELGRLVLATLLSYPFGLAIGIPWLLPLLNTAPAYWLMARRLRAGDRKGAVAAMLLWASALLVFGTAFFALWPRDPGPLVLNGVSYREEMFHWIRTGEGSEGSPQRFLPQHLGHLAAFVVLSLASASALSILLGAILMNYMDYYVASLARAGAPLLPATLVGWHIWSVCRVAAFCTLGVVLAEPLLSRVLRYRYAGLREARVYVLWAAAGLLLDVILKALLAPTWGLWLRRLLSGG
jgi:hypothetical protein